MTCTRRDTVTARGGGLRPCTWLLPLARTSLPHATMEAIRPCARPSDHAHLPRAPTLAWDPSASTGPGEQVRSGHHRGAASGRLLSTHCIPGTPGSRVKSEQKAPRPAPPNGAAFPQHRPPPGARVRRRSKAGTSLEVASSRPPRPSHCSTLHKMKTNSKPIIEPMSPRPRGPLTIRVRTLPASRARRGGTEPPSRRRTRTTRGHAASSTKSWRFPCCPGERWSGC
jgi:hypothetical protein